MKKGRYADAFKSFCRLRKHRLIAARDLYYSHVLFEEELRLARGASYFTRLADCFRVPRIRRATLGASVVMLAQQMCGINSELLYDRSHRSGADTHIRQSSLSTARPSSLREATRSTKPYTHPSGSALSTLCLPFLPSSRSTHLAVDRFSSAWVAVVSTGIVFPDIS
jgi:hypothetical protein